MRGSFAVRSSFAPHEKFENSRTGYNLILSSISILPSPDYPDARFPYQSKEKQVCHTQKSCAFLSNHSPFHNQIFSHRMTVTKAYSSGFFKHFPGDPNFSIKILRAPKQTFYLPKLVRVVSLNCWASQSLWMFGGLFWLFWATQCRNGFVVVCLQW